MQIICPFCSGKLNILFNNYIYCSKCNIAISKTHKKNYDDLYYYRSDDRKKFKKRSQKLLTILKEIITFTPTTTMLDFGCGNGAFVALAVKNGLNCDGVDINDTDIKIANNLGGGRFYKPTEINEKYDIITAFDVIEHFENPNLFFQEIKKYLKKDGILFITTPNLNSRWIKHFNNGWHGFHIPQYHRFIFTKKSLTDNAKRINLTPFLYREYATIGSNPLKLILGSNYLLKNNKLIAIISGMFKYFLLIISNQINTDTIFMGLKENSKPSSILETTK